MPNRSEKITITPDMFGFLPASTGFVGIVYCLVIPVLVAQFLALMLLPSLASDGHRPLQVAKAVFCYLLQSIALTMMLLSSFPALWGVLSGSMYPSRIYLLLLVIFTVGGLTFLWHDSIMQTIDEPSKALPSAIYRYTWKFVGFIMSVVSGLLLVTNMIVVPELLTAGWWVGPVLLLAYGLLISWCTRWPAGHTILFQTSPMKKPPVAPVHPLHKTASKRRSK